MGKTGTHEDIDVLARTIWGEARGEGREGMLAVSAVVINRVRNRRWPGDVVAVCQQPYQFSCWNYNDPNLNKLLYVGEEDPMFQVALGLAALQLSDSFIDPTDGADHYHTKDILPYWAKGEQPTITIGRHKFYRLA